MSEGVEEARKKILEAAETGAKKLDLAKMGLETIPGEIARCVALEELDLSANRLANLPDEIAALEHLSSLWLHQNRLSALPSWLGTLQKLLALHIALNPLATFPRVVLDVRTLTHLFAWNTQIAELPEDLGKLSQLMHLDVGFNKIRALPSSIGSLQKLEYLSLTACRLAALPSALRELPRLKILSVHGNPIPIPSEVIDGGNAQKILTYYFSTVGSKDAQRPLNEVKLLLVGEGDVGKTSLVNRLVHDRFDRHEPKTEGILRCAWWLKISRDKVQVNVWDFGGQEIMHATHQFFLSSRSVYIVVLNARRNDDGNNLRDWLETARTFGKGSPILVVVNKIDEHPMELNVADLRRKYPEIAAVLSTSCSDGRGIDELRKEIEKAIEKLPDVRAPLPVTWFDVKTKLEAMTEREHWVGDAAYLALCNEHGIVADAARDTLVGILHDLGVILSYPDLALKDTKVLSPSWITEAVYKLVNDRALLENGGVFAYADLKRLLDAQRYPPGKYGYLIEVMKKFELCFTLDGDGSQFLLPDLLSPEERPIWGDWKPSMRIHYEYAVLPSSIMSRFIARTHAIAYKRMYWRSGTMLEKRGARALVAADRAERRVRIELGGDDPQQCSDLLAVIRDHLDTIHRSIEPPELRIAVEPNSEVTVSFDFLLQLAREGERTVRPEGTKRAYEVAALLRGIRTDRDRMGAIRGYEAMKHAESVEVVNPTSRPPSPPQPEPESWSLPRLVGSIAVLIVAFAIAVNLVGAASATAFIGGAVALVIIVTAVGLRAQGKIKEATFAQLLGEAAKLYAGAPSARRLGESAEAPKKLPPKRRKKPT